MVKKLKVDFTKTLKCLRKGSRAGLTASVVEADCSLCELVRKLLGGITLVVDSMCSEIPVQLSSIHHV